MLLLFYATIRNKVPFFNRSFRHMKCDPTNLSISNLVDLIRYATALFCNFGFYKNSNLPDSIFDSSISSSFSASAGTCNCFNDVITDRFTDKYIKSVHIFSLSLS